MKMRLDGILAPVSSEEFFQRYVFKEPLFVQGTSDKFDSLFRWDCLNRLLSYSRHDAIRVHLDRVGTHSENLPFTHHVRNVRGEDILRIDVPALYGHLRDGATLVVDAVNEVDPEVADLTEEIGAVFSTSAATTVLFCSFGHTPGFMIHWDSRDVFALQVEGEKYWTIHEPSRDAPLGRGDATIPGSGQPGRLVWEGTMRRGDLLYIPRGWWHEVKSTDSSSVHLALGVAPITGVDFATWLAEELKADAFMRRDVPRFSSREALDEYQRSLVAKITERLHPSSVTDFLAARRASARPQTHVSLPLGLRPQHGSPTPAHRVRFVTRLVEVIDDGSAIVLRGGGRETSVPIWTKPMMARLRAAPSASIAELAATVGDVAMTDVCATVAALIEQGFICTALHGDPRPGSEAAP